MNYYELAETIDSMDDFFSRQKNLTEEDVAYEVKRRNLQKMASDLFFPAYDEYSISEKTGVSEGQIANYLQGKSMPREKTLIKLFAHRNPDSTVTAKEFVSACKALCDAYEAQRHVHFRETEMNRYSVRPLSKGDVTARKTSTEYFRHFLAARAAELHQIQVFSKERCNLQDREDDYALCSSENFKDFIEDVFNAKITLQTQEALDRIAESVAASMMSRWMPKDN